MLQAKTAQMTASRDGGRDMSAALQAYLQQQWQPSRLTVGKPQPLSRGAFQHNLAFHVEATAGRFPGQHDLVMRMDAPGADGVGILSRADEFAVLQAAAGAGVTVPEPVLVCTDPAVVGLPFVLMRRVTGEAQGRKLVQAPELQGAGGEALAEQLGRKLARLHGLTPEGEGALALGFLPGAGEAASTRRITEYRAALDGLPAPQPALEAGLRWLELNMPSSGRQALCHGDFRTGNYLGQQGQLSAILDWEFASWSEPMEDVGWFMARCWRFGRRAAEAGGIGSRSAFYRGYDEEAARLGLDHQIDVAAVPYWEVMALIRWGIIALQQGQRGNKEAGMGGQAALELALTAPIALETAYDMLEQIAEIEAGRGGSA